MTFDFTENWDFLTFFVGVVLAALGLEFWLRRSRSHSTLSAPVWVLLFVMLGSGWFFIHSAAERERARMRTLVLGFAPTYALVMQHLGHEKITLQTPPDDPRYLRLIEAQKRLLEVNPSINDIYTMRKLPGGETVFIVDSETDYDRNGRIEGPREGRTKIGEVYPTEEAEIERALRGESVFASQPITDRWGTWVSAFHPIRGATGEVEAIIGVDFDAAHWISSIRSVRLGGIGTLGMLIAIVLGAATIISQLRSHIVAQAVAQRELAQARDEAIVAARQKADFLANMSHEIRTPMNGILGVTGLLLETELTPQQRADALTIRTSADALLSILNDILDFSKVEAGKLTFENVDFDVREAIEGVLDLVAEPAAAKHLEIVHTIDASVPRALRGDPGRLRQILLNLLGNALKFTEAGQVSLRVATEGTLLRFEVSDTGIGLSPEQQRNIFGAFVQGDSSTARKFGGTGLGLAISKQLVENMGGEIGVRSEPGKGSTFWFTCQLQPAEASPSVPRTPSQGSARLQGLRVLIADDNSVNRMVGIRQLRQLGCYAAAVANGKEAISEITRIAYDVVLMDCQMSEMDGYEATRRLRALGFSLPIIALTADAMKGARERCLAAGMSDYLSKPVRLPDLKEVLERIFPSETPTMSEEDAAFASELTAAFCSETAEVMKDIQEAISSADTARLLRALHKMKGACGAFGAEGLMQTCSRMEARIDAAEGPDLVALADDLHAEHQRTLDTLERGDFTTAG